MRLSAAYHRRLVDLICVHGCPNMLVVVGGGVILNECVRVSVALKGREGEVGGTQVFLNKNVLAASHFGEKPLPLLLTDVCRCAQQSYKRI